MFVGGPNTRTDFHIDQSSEFFWMLKGNMELPIIERGVKRVVRIGEGQVFLLPPRIPHSPQRPESGSLGLVIERERNREMNELDGLRWYTDFETCKDVLWERYFYCNDLGRDLVPVVQAFKSSEEAKTGVPSDESVCRPAPVEQDVTTVVPEPFDLLAWIDTHRKELESGAVMPLFGEEHPDRQIKVVVAGGKALQKVEATEFGVETLLVQLEGSCKVSVGGEESSTLEEGCCAVMKAGVKLTLERPEGSIGLVIQQYPK